jgi:hypothetical protein
MSCLIRSLLLLFSMCAFCGAQASSALNSLSIVVANGPFAGTYTAPGSEVICLHAKAQEVYSVARKDFNAPGAKAIAEAGIEVVNPDVPGAKHGTVRIAFGDPHKYPTIYTVLHAPVTLIIQGTSAEISFEGRTNEGIALRTTASCIEVENL